MFTTGSDAEELICRPKEITDNAVPSANSAAAGGPAAAGHPHRQVPTTSTGPTTYLALLGEVAANHPSGFGHLLEATDMDATGLTEVVIVGDRPDLVDAVQDHYRPNTVLAWGEPYDSPLWESRTDALAYVCRNYTCEAPASTIEELLARL